MLTLWTIQKEEVLKVLTKKGFLSGSKKYISDSLFIRPYLWMKHHMKDRLNISSNDFPIWAWKTPKPDLRRKGYDASGTKLVLIEIKINENKVLLSDFETWHDILNSYDKKIPKNSFKYIFNTKKSESVQATFYGLHIEEIVSVRKFTAK